MRTAGPVSRFVWLRVRAAAACFVAFAWTASAVSEPRPLYSAALPGADIPDQGRSLFDYLVADAESDSGYRIPFPFTRLVAYLRRELGEGARVEQILIPMGRSLQRSAARPHFFQFPRVVLAVTRDGTPPDEDAGWRAANRLFLGYQESAGVIEVISYNDALGRFEFQVVDQYRLGQIPIVQYAPRKTCIACHQNHAPLFSRPLWGETNANDDVGRMLADIAPTFYGVPARVSVDVADAIDTATDRANEISVWQQVWRDVCSGDGRWASECRKRVLGAALRYRLAGDRLDLPGTESLTASLAPRWPSLWRAGVAFPSSDIPNRRLELYRTHGTLLGLPAGMSATTPVPGDSLLAQTRVPPRLEPFAARQPSEVWREWRPERTARWVAGLGDSFSVTDIQRLDRALRKEVLPPESDAREIDALTEVIAEIPTENLGVYSFSRRRLMQSVEARFPVQQVRWHERRELPAPVLSGPR